MKLICAALCACFLLPLPACGAESGFRDVSTEAWYYEPVLFLKERALLDGFPDGSFRPDEPLTMAQLVKLLYADAPAETEADALWWEPYFRMAAETGALAEDDRERMDLPVDRYTAARLLGTFLMTRESRDTLGRIDRAAVLGHLRDLPDIPEEDLETVVPVYGLGILQGYEDGCFHGNELLSRAQGAAILQRVLVPEKRTPVWKKFLTAEERLSDTLFVGNSLCAGLYLYGGLDSSGFLYCTGGSIFSMTQLDYYDRNGGKGTLKEKIGEKPYGTVVLIYGTNEMGYDTDYVRKHFASFVEKIREAQPEAEIWLMTAPPMNESRFPSEQFTNRNCEKVNGIIRDLCAEKGYGLIELHDHLADSSGGLPRENTTDGIHLTGEGYQEWADWLRTLFS